jgi:phenylpropionate dioxygenase-like ring-hydroxylating dioxygenase large terminal subunit
MSERHVAGQTLSDELVAYLTDQMAWEFSRTGPPEGFPAFPDVSAERYTSEAFYNLEQQHLWPTSWIVAGRVEDLPSNGSYFLFDELGPPLIVIRGDDGVIRCFSNTCRHRGAPIVREPTGTVRNMRCQYHAWTYGITGGDLIAITDERDFIGICKEERDLPQIRCETWGGWVWVNFDANAIPLLEFLGKIPGEMAHFDCENLRLVDTDHRVVDCNWKVAVEAFQEVYHFRFIHDRGGVNVLDQRGATMGLLANGNSRMVVPHSKHIVEATGRKSWSDYQKMPGVGGLEPVPGVHPIVHSTSYSFTVFPNLITPVAAAGFPIMLFFPDGIGRTNIRIYHFGPDWGDGPAPEAWKERVSSFAEIIDEDVENLSPMHRAMESPLFHSVPLSYQERRIWHFNETIDQKIGAERIPEHLRVPTLLDDYLES